MLRLSLFLFLLCSVAGKAFAVDIVVEAESFQNKGGWKVDQQFMDVMGSPYLIAHGMGFPVEDASTFIHIPQAGTYAVYVRTYNWTSPWSQKEGPGKFVLSIQDKHLSVAGHQGNKWQWQRVGIMKLNRGKVKLQLHDITGFDGRCDAVLLTTDTQRVPLDGEAFNQQRTLLARQSMKQASRQPFDLVVVGGGVAGISAAVSAARLGLKVALLQNRPILGGNNSSEVRVHLGGKIGIGQYPRLGGLQNEFGPTKEGNAMPADHYADHKKMNIVQAEPNISLFMNHHVNRVSTHAGRIVSIEAQHIETGQVINVQGKYFADCTGDATVGYLAGAHYMMGREARTTFNEELAPAEADSLMMGASVQWYSVETPQHNTFPEFHYGITFTNDNAERVKRGEWTWETGLNQDQINHFERIRDYGLLVVYANWSFLKNHAHDKTEYAHSKLSWVAYVAGKRETRRLKGDYVLTENDLTKHIAHRDASFTTSWSIDLHYPDSANSRLFPGNEFKAITKQKVLFPYTVPYRCLYSENISNLFMAGRNISTSHIALGSTRVMRTAGAMGEVVGMAASICCKHNATPRMVYLHHLEELKSLMMRGVDKDGIPHNQNYNEG